MKSSGVKLLSTCELDLDDARSVLASLTAELDRTQVVSEVETLAAADKRFKGRNRGLITVELTSPAGKVRLHRPSAEADLSPWIQHRSGPLFWILNPESPGCLIVHDPKRSHVLMMPVRGSADEEREVPERLAASLGTPLCPKILSIDSGSPHVQVAARYREGRVFLVGDAAHRFPPTGGLGLNTGIQEAHDLVGRLARVESGREDAALLDGYEALCRPVAQSNADESFENLRRLAEISRAIGEWPDLAGLERRIRSLSGAERQQLAEAIEAQRSHFTSDGSPLEAVIEPVMNGSVIGQ